MMTFSYVWDLWDYGNEDEQQKYSKDRVDEFDNVGLTRINKITLKKFPQWK